MNNKNTTFSGLIAQGFGTGGSLTKIGTGTFTFNGFTTYTDATTVNGGTLGGNGAINGAVTVNSGATLAPGPTGPGSTGILNTGAFTLNSGSNFSLDLNGPLAGTNYDQISVTGAVTLGLTSNLVIDSVSGLTAGETLFIVENDGSDAVTGTFAGLANGATFTADSVTFQIDYFASGQGGGNDIELSVVSVPPVPEPSTWVSGALACAFLAYTQRRRFAQMLRRA
jgi:fibronectin-binding autotransporter adhesin